MLGLMMTTSLNAQSTPLTQKLSDMSTAYTSLQQTFAPGSAKWVAVGNLVNHIETTIDGINNDPNYMLADDGYAIDRKNNPIWLNVHPTILAVYTDDQLAAMQDRLVQLTLEGAPEESKFKIQKILEVNAY